MGLPGALLAVPVAAGLQVLLVDLGLFNERTPAVAAEVAEEQGAPIASPPVAPEPGLVGGGLGDGLRDDLLLAVWAGTSHLWAGVARIGAVGHRGVLFVVLILGPESSWLGYVKQLRSG